MRTLVLICEDDDVLRELIRASLDGDYRFAEAASVAEAKQALDVALPAVALVDLMLPGGSGVDVLNEVRRRDPDGRIKTVVVSAWTTNDYRAAAANAGADAFVAKPFLPEELSAVVSALLDGP